MEESRPLYEVTLPAPVVLPELHISGKGCVETPEEGFGYACLLEEG